MKTKLQDLVEEAKAAYPHVEDLLNIYDQITETYPTHYEEFKLFVFDIKQCIEEQGRDNNVYG